MKIKIGENTIEVLENRLQSLPRKIAQFDVDIQNTFTELCPQELAVPGALEIIESVNKLAALVDYRCASKDEHDDPNPVWRTDDVNMIQQPTGNPQAPHYWVMHGQPGTFGGLLVEGMPNESDFDFLVKKGMGAELHPYGACYHDPLNTISTGVIEWSVENDVTDWVVTGLAYDHCVATTARELASTGLFNVIMIRECSKGIDPSSFPRIEKELAELGVVFYDTVEQYQETLK